VLPPRDEVLRERVPVLRDLAPPLAAPARDVVERDEPALLPLERDEPLPADLARVEPDFAPPEAERVLPEVEDFARDVVERVPVDLEPLLRELPEREPPLLDRDPPELARALLPREDDEPLLELEPSSLHLPDITRCAASATASAISEPSLVALVTMLLAACDAVSAASRPASRILRRAAGLALIAAAAAARPAASISLLIAALASLSTVVSSFLLVEREELVFVERVEPLRADLAIASISLRWRRRHFKAVTVP
jgi:hypothetical protein